MEKDPSHTSQSPGSTTSHVGPPRLTQLFHLYATGLQSSNDYVGGLQGREAVSNINRAITTNNRILESLMIQHSTQMNLWEKKRMAQAQAREQQQQLLLIQNTSLSSSPSLKSAVAALQEAPPMWLPPTNGLSNGANINGETISAGGAMIDGNSCEGGVKHGEEKRFRDIAETSAASILTTSMIKAAASKNKSQSQPAKIVATDALTVAQNSADAQWVLLVQKSPLHRISADEIEHIRTEWFVVAAQKSRNDNWRIQLKSKLESAGIMTVPTRKAAGEEMDGNILRSSWTDVNGHANGDMAGRQDTEEYQNKNNTVDGGDGDRPYSPLLPLTSEASPPRFLAKGGSNFHQKTESGWISDSDSKQKHKLRGGGQSPTLTAARSAINSPTTPTPTTPTTNSNNTWGTTAHIPVEILREVLAYQNCFQTAKDDEEEADHPKLYEDNHPDDAPEDGVEGDREEGVRKGGGIALASLSFDSSSGAASPSNNKNNTNDNDVKTKEDRDAEALAARQKLPPTVPHHIYQSLPYFQSEITMGEFSRLLKDFLIRSGTFNERGMKRSYQQLLEQVKRQRSKDNNPKNSTTLTSMSKSGALMSVGSATFGRGVHFRGEVEQISNTNENGLEVISSGYFAKDAAAAASSSLQSQPNSGLINGRGGKSINSTFFDKNKVGGASENNNSIEQQRTGIKRSTELAGYLKDVFESIDKLFGNNNDVVTENDEFTNNNNHTAYSGGNGGGKGGGSKGTVNWDQFLTYLLSHVYDISPDQWASPSATRKHQTPAPAQKSGDGEASSAVVLAGPAQTNSTNLHLPLQQRILISALSGVGVSDYVIESIRSGMGMTATDVPPQILARIARHGNIKALKAVKRALGGPPSFEVLGITRKKLLAEPVDDESTSRGKIDLHDVTTSTKSNNNINQTSSRRKAAASGLEATAIMKPDLQFRGLYNTTVPRSGIHSFMKMEFFDHWRAIVALDNKTAAIFLTEDVAVWGQQPGTPSAMLTAAGEVVDDDVSGAGAATSGFSAKVHVTGACDDPNDTQPGTTSSSSSQQQQRRGASSQQQQQADSGHVREGFAFVDDDVPGGAKYLHFDGKVLACELLIRSKLLVFSCASRAQLYIFMVGHNRHTVKLLSHCAVPLLPLEYHDSTERYKRLQLQRKQQAPGGGNTTTTTSSTKHGGPDYLSNTTMSSSLRLNATSPTPNVNNLSSSVIINPISGTDVDINHPANNIDDGFDTAYESKLIAQYNANTTPTAVDTTTHNNGAEEEEENDLLLAMIGGDDENVVGKSRGIARRHECAILKERRAIELRQMREARGGLPQQQRALGGGGVDNSNTSHRHLPGTTSSAPRHSPPPPVPMPTASSTATITCLRVWRDREGTITGMGHGGGAATYILLGGTREGIFFGLSLLDSEALRRGHVKDTRKDKHSGGGSTNHPSSSESGGGNNASNTAAPSTGSLPVGPKVLFQYPVHKGAITDILVLPKSNRVVTCGLDGKLYSHYPNGANILSQDRSGVGGDDDDDVNQNDGYYGQHNSSSQIHGDWARTRHSYVGGHRRAITSLAVVGADALGATSSSTTALSTSNSKSGGGGGDVFVSAGVEYNIYCWADTMPRPLLVLSDPFSTPHRHAIVRVMGVEHTSTIYSVDASGLVKLFNVNSGRCIGTWNSTSVARGHNNSDNNAGGGDDEEDGAGESAEGMNTGGNNIAPLSTSAKGVYGVRKGGGTAKASLFSTSNSTKAMMASSIAIGPAASSPFKGGGGGGRGGGINTEMPSVFSACFTGSTHRTLLLGSDILRRFHTEKRDINASKATSTSDPILAIGVGLGASVGFKESSHFSVIVTVCARNFTTWSVRTGMRIQVVDTDTFSPAWTTAAAVDGGCGHVVVGKATGVVEVFDVHTGNMSRRYSFHTSRITSVALDSVAGLIFTSSTAGDMCVWNNIDFKTHSHFLGAGSDSGILRVKRAHYSKLKLQGDDAAAGQYQQGQSNATTIMKGAAVGTDMASIGQLRVAPVAPLTTAPYGKSASVGLGELGRANRATAALTNTTLNTSTMLIPNQQQSSSSSSIPVQLYQEPETSYLRPIRLLSQAAWLTGHLYFTLGALRGKELTSWEKKQGEKQNQRRHKSSDFSSMFGESPLLGSGAGGNISTAIVTPPLFLRNTPRTATVLDLLHSCGGGNSSYGSSPFSQETNNNSVALKPLLRQYAGVVAYLPEITQTLFTEGQNARKAKDLLRQQHLEQAATFAPSRVHTPSSRRNGEPKTATVVRKSNNTSANNNNGKSLLKEAKLANEKPPTATSTPPFTSSSHVEKKLSQFKTSQETILEDRAVLCRRAQLAWWVYNRWRNFMAQNTRRRGEDADSGARVVYRPIVSVQLATASGGYSAKQICVHPGSMRAVVMSQCNLVTVVDYAWIGSRALYFARHQHRMEVLKRCIHIVEMEAAVGIQWESGIAASMSFGTTSPSVAALQRKLRSTRRQSIQSPQSSALLGGGLSPGGSTPGHRRFSVGFGGGVDSPGGGGAAISHILDNLESLERLMLQGVGGGPATTQQQHGIDGDEDDDETRLFALPSCSPILQPPPIQVVCSIKSSAPLYGNYHQRRRTSSIFTKPNVGLQNSTNTANEGVRGISLTTAATGTFTGMFGGDSSNSSDDDSSSTRGDYSLNRFGPSTHLVLIPHRNVSSSSTSQKKGAAGKQDSPSMSKTVGIHSLGLSTLTSTSTTTTQQRGRGGSSSVVSITAQQQQLAEFSQLEIAAVCFGGSSHLIFTADSRGYIYLWVLRFDQGRRPEDIDPIADADLHFAEELSSALGAAGLEEEATRSYTSAIRGNTTPDSKMLDKEESMGMEDGLARSGMSTTNNPKDPHPSAARVSRLEAESRFSVEFDVVHERSFCTPMLLVCFKAVETRAERDVSVAEHRSKVTRKAARKYERRKARKADELKRVSSSNATTGGGGDPRKSIHHPKNMAAVFGVPNDYCISTSEEDFDLFNSEDSSSHSSDENPNFGRGKHHNNASRSFFGGDSSAAPQTLHQLTQQGSHHRFDQTSNATPASSRISTARSNPTGHPPVGVPSTSSPSLLLARITCMTFDLGRFTLLVGDDGGDVRMFEIEPCFTSYPCYDPLVAAGAHHPTPDDNMTQQACVSVIKSKDAPKKKKSYAHLQKLNLLRSGGAASVPVGCPPRHVATIRASDAPIAIVVGLAGVTDAGTAMPVSLFGHMTIAGGPLESGISAQTLLEITDPTTFNKKPSTPSSPSSISDDKLKKSTNGISSKKSSAGTGISSLATSPTTDSTEPSHVTVTQLELYPARTTSALQGVCTVSGNGVVQWASYAGDVVATLRRGPVVNRTWSLGCGAVYLEGEQPPQDGAGTATAPLATSSAPNWLIERVGVVGLRWWKLTAAVANGREWTETAWRILSQIQGDHNPRAATPAVTRALGRLKLLMRSRSTLSQSTPGTRDRQQVANNNPSIPLPPAQGSNIVPSLHTALTAHCIMSYEFRWIKPGSSVVGGGGAFSATTTPSSATGSHSPASSEGGTTMRGQGGSKQPILAAATTSLEPKIVHPEHPDAVLAIMLKLAPAPPIVHPELLNWIVKGDAWCPKRIRRRDRRRKQQLSEAVSGDGGIFSDKTPSPRGNSIIAGGVGRKGTLPNVASTSTTTSRNNNHRGSSFAQHTPPQQLLRPSTAAGSSIEPSSLLSKDYLLVRPDDDVDEGNGDYPHDFNNNTPSFFVDTEGGSGRGEEQQKQSSPATRIAPGEGEVKGGGDQEEAIQSNMFFLGGEEGHTPLNAVTSKRPVILSHQPISAPKMKCKLGRSGYVRNGGDASSSSGATSSPLGFGKKGKRKTNPSEADGVDLVSFVDGISSNASAAGSVVLPPLSGQQPPVSVALHPLLQQLDAAVLVSANRASDLQQRVIVDSRIRLQTKPEQHRPVGPPPNATKNIWVPSSSNVASMSDTSATTNPSSNLKSSVNSHAPRSSTVGEDEPLRAFLLKDYDEGDETRPAKDYSIPRESSERRSKNKTPTSPSRHRGSGGGSRSKSPGGCMTPTSPKKSSASQEADKIRPAPSPGRETTEWYSKLIVPSNTCSSGGDTTIAVRRATTGTTNSTTTVVEELSSRVVDARAQIRRSAAGTGRMTHRQLKDLTSPNRILRGAISSHTNNAPSSTNAQLSQQSPISAPSVLQPRGEVRLAGVGAMSLGGSK